MAKELKDVFPMLQSREEVLKNIHSDEHLKKMFYDWKPEEQKEFLDICTGAHGVKMLYDGVFKEVMNPEYAPQRLNDFLSHVLGEKVRVMKVLPNDSTRLTDESSLLVMDIVVEFEGGAIGNIEVQKMGYLFPGERSACYSADLLLRQYRRLRDEKKKKFSYRDIRTVYTIVLFEHSPKEFQACPNVYRHCFEQKSDTGLELNMPQKFIYISLDIFRKKHQNENGNTKNKLEAWLTFFCRDEPEIILNLIEKYPEFKPLYEDVYELCRNVEGVMQLFSKELLEMDRNTVRLMIDEMQEEIDGMHEELDGVQDELEKKAQELDEMQEKLEEKSMALKEKVAILGEKDQELKEKDKEIESVKQQNETFARRIAELEKKLLEK